VAGFPIAVVCAWAYELTPQGIKKTEEVPRQESIARSTGRKLDFFVIFVLALAVGVLLFQRWHAPSRNDTGTGGFSEKSIAVLPFENLSSDKENTYFADGIQDEILTRLSKDRRPEGDLADFDRALQERAGKHARDRNPAWGGKHRGGQCAEERRRGARECAANQMR
jgi:hypothetical protein